jgi:alanyl-tRNA synthetase
MTERLYYTDSFLTRFKARVLSCVPSGERYAVRLDRTAFYPTSGGQPHDTGRLGAARVLEVIEDGDDIVHLTDRPVEPGPIEGEIDWSRRFDHMQQHTGQHLLSAAFLHLFGFPTVSFHLGRQVSTIDLQAVSVVARHLEEAELRANEIIFEDRPVRISFSGEAELKDRAIRKAVERRGLLRIVEIADVDVQPCGGTHVAHTGQVGQLQIRHLERQRGFWRVEFVCGGRALEAAREDRVSLTAAARTIGCGRSEVPGMVSKMLEEARRLRQQMEKLEQRLAELEARARMRPGGVVLEAIADGRPEWLRRLAAALLQEGVRAVFLVGADTKAVVCARARDAGVDAAGILRQIFSLVGGRGGGSAEFAQGTLPAGAPVEAVLERARQLLAATASPQAG